MAQKKFDNRISKIQKSKFKKFNTAAHKVELNLENILNFFNNRNTSDNVESFNSKIKLFRANLRGVSDISFFLFRLHKLFA
jgi:transposase